MQRKLAVKEVDELINEWRKHKIDAMFAMVSDMITTGGNSRSLVKDGAPSEINQQSAPQLVEA